MKNDFILKTTAGEIHMDMEERAGKKYLTVRADDFTKLGVIIQDLIGMGYGYRVIEVNKITNPNPSGYTKEQMMELLGVSSDDLDLIINGKCTLKVKEDASLYNTNISTGLSDLGGVVSYATFSMDWDYEKLNMKEISFYKVAEIYMIIIQNKTFIPEDQSSEIFNIPVNWSTVAEGGDYTYSQLASLLQLEKEQDLGKIYSANVVKIRETSTTYASCNKKVEQTGENSGVFTILDPASSGTIIITETNARYTITKNDFYQAEL